jgi:leader peptidase (prepilin peptidase)/N-methyltransferase
LLFSLRFLPAWTSHADGEPVNESFTRRENGPIIPLTGGSGNLQEVGELARFGADALALRGDAAMSAILFAWLFLAGAVWASFCGLLAFRLPRAMGWAEGPAVGLSHPPSSCDGCGARIRPLHLVPVLGWVAARGACGNCGAKVPARYPVVEAATGALTAAAPLLGGGATGLTLAIVLLAWACLAAAWVDLESHILPESVTLPLFFGGLLWSPLEPDTQLRVWGAALCAAAMWGSLRIVGRMRRVDAMSGGDVALAAVGGAWLGAGAAGTFLLGSCLLFAVHAALASRSGARWVPMGPALASALVASACWVASDRGAFLAAQGLTS